MIIRPLDADGDVLPVTASSDLLRGVRADAQLILERLQLLTGDWWENRSWGNEVVDMMKESRFTEEDQQTLATYLASYVRETPGVQEVRDMSFSAAGRQFRFTCTIETENGTAAIDYEI